LIDRARARINAIETITISTSSEESVMEIPAEPEVPAMPAQPEVIRISSSSSSDESVKVIPTARPIAVVRPTQRPTPEPEMPDDPNDPNDQTWGTWGNVYTQEEVERANHSVPFLPDVSFASEQSTTDNFNNRSWDISDVD
jgi:hypothetical protein